ncbi:RNA-binding protein with multiple splicing [Rhynchospora pubera]|uniref:RNA-binding protein with multiple splicing n=1 Tax=Rhynchospora pubera TaxID=906938 RepID=A0AAV8C0B1_9POAL|nr:RNA-binding protein with multiple splicing [Rhynchospora pubera]
MEAPPPIYAHPNPYPEDPYYYAPPPPPEDALAFAAQHHLADREQGKICTLFVAGLPDDVKPREIYNLFSCRSGFESCLLEFTGKGNQAVAFVTFYTHQAALAAMTTLNGAIFDPDTGDTLFIELARSNSRKSSRESGPYRVIDKRIKANDQESHDEANAQYGDDDDGLDDPNDINNTDNGSEGEHPDNNFGASTEQSVETDSRKRKGLSSSDEKVEGGLQPCTTLFIANLGPACSKEELTEALSNYPGLQTLKLLRRGGMPVAFADFQDIESSTEALNGLHGTYLPSSDRGAVHIEYARSKMRKS